ncbi:MAG: flagellar assembly protein FliW [Spirochaetota bacterium]
MGFTIHSRPFGEIEISEKQILTFKEGLFGFDNCEKFALIEEESQAPFQWLQSLEEKDLAFIVIQPNIFLESYDPLLTEEELAEIDLQKTAQGFSLLIVTIPNEDMSKMTANLQGPVVINPEKKLAKQYISRDPAHPIRYQMMPANAEVEEKE